MCQNVRVVPEMCSNLIAVIVHIFQMTRRSNLAPDYVKFVDFVQSAITVMGTLLRARTLLMRACGISLLDEHKQRTPNRLI